MWDTVVNVGLPQSFAIQALLLAEVEAGAGEATGLAGSEHRIRTWLEGEVGGGLALRIDGQRAERLPLPEGALQAVMTRYGGTVDEGLEPQIAALEPGIVLADRSVLCSFRFRPRYDVIAKDYLVWKVSGRPSRAELCVAVCAALTHLARAMQARS